MTSREYATFLDLLLDVVNGNGTWQDKRDNLKAEADEDHLTALEELSEWFAPVEEQ